MFLINWFQESVLSNTLMILFLVAFIGYLVGSITIKGVELGTAGVLLVALVIGHFIGNNEELIDGLGMFQDLGLICFVTSVGFIAGPKFFRNFKINAKSYILLGFIIIAIGAINLYLWNKWQNKRYAHRHIAIQQVISAIIVCIWRYTFVILLAGKLLVAITAYNAFGRFPPFFIQRIFERQI